jgi:hypothetical protein
LQYEAGEDKDAGGGQREAENPLGDEEAQGLVEVLGKALGAVRVEKNELEGEKKNERYLKCLMDMKARLRVLTTTSKLY